MGRKSKEISDEPTNEPIEQTGFKLLKTGNFFTVVQINKGRAVTIMHNADVPQSRLKEVYDAGQHYQKLIQAPKGYKAPWQ